VKAVSAATPEQIAAAVPGIGPKLAETVVTALRATQGTRGASRAATPVLADQEPGDNGDGSLISD